MFFALLELLSKPETYVMLASLAALEIVLGIDNIVFITILITMSFAILLFVRKTESCVQ